VSSTNVVHCKVFYILIFDCGLYLADVYTYVESF